jgi:putative transposase
MPRSSRIDLPGLPQHVVVRGNNRNPIFFRDFDRALFLKLLGTARADRSCAVHSFVLMPNHVHLLATPYERGALSRMVQDVGRIYVHHVNTTYKRTGGLYEGRFYSSLVESSRYFLTCMRYIELNPVRAGLAARPTDYEWSSYGNNVTGDPTGLITAHPEYLALGADAHRRAAAYRRLFDEAVDGAEIDRIRQCAKQGRALGSELFCEAVEATLKRPVTCQPQGRPCGVA